MIYGSTVPAVRKVVRGETSDPADREHIRRIRVAPLVESGRPTGRPGRAKRRGSRPNAPRLELAAASPNLADPELTSGSSAGRTPAASRRNRDRRARSAGRDGRRDAPARPIRPRAAAPVPGPSPTRRRPVRRRRRRPRLRTTRPNWIGRRSRASRRPPTATAGRRGPPERRDRTRGRRLGRGLRKRCAPPAGAVGPVTATGASGRRVSRRCRDAERRDRDAVFIDGPGARERPGGGCRTPDRPATDRARRAGRWRWST